MGFLDTLKEVMTNKPSNLREPKFIKEFNEDNKQLKDLEELLSVASEDTIKDIEKDMKLLSYGLLGEKNVAYELENSHMPILILHDLYLKYNNLTAQIDFVVIGQRFILVVECKNMVGDIEITSSGDFIRYFKTTNGKVYKKEGMYSPIVQNERHVELIRDVLRNEGYFKKTDFGMVKHVVTVANSKAVINSKYAKKELNEHIIKHEQLINKMKQLHDANKDGRWFTEESMYNLADSLMKYNETYTIDYEKKYGVSVVPNVEENPTNNEKEEIISQEEIIEVADKNNIKDLDCLEESKIYKELKEYRLKKSREEKVKPYFLYNNQEMEAIIEVKPKDIEELKSIKGFGNVKCEKYGAEIIDIVKRNL